MRKADNVQSSRTEIQRDDLLYPKEVYAIIGAAMEVHRNLGCGFLESVYQEAFAIELTLRELPFEEQKELDVFYKGRKLSKRFIADFFVYEKIIVEIKSVDKLTVIHEAQLLNYLKACDIELGILINFHSSPLEWVRRVFTK